MIGRLKNAFGHATCKDSVTIDLEPVRTSGGGEYHVNIFWETEAMNILLRRY